MYSKRGLFNSPFTIVLSLPEVRLLVHDVALCVSFNYVGCKKRNNGSLGTWGQMVKFCLSSSDSIIGALHTDSYTWKQKCIPVGCVPAARWPYARVSFTGGRGVYLFLGSVLSPGVYLGTGGACLPGGCLPGRGVCLPLRGECLPGGLTWGGGVCWGCVYPSMHWGRHPPPVDRMTDACKNITLAQLRCGP